MFVTLDTHGLHTLSVCTAVRTQTVLKTKQRGPGSSSGWSWQQRVLFALVRLGGGLGSACKPWVGQEQEDAFNRCVTLYHSLPEAHDSRILG